MRFGADFLQTPWYRVSIGLELCVTRDFSYLMVTVLWWSLMLSLTEERGGR